MKNQRSVLRSIQILLIYRYIPTEPDLYSVRQFLTESCSNGKEYPVRGECCSLYVPSACAVLGLDGKWDEDNLCGLPGRAIALLRGPAEAAAPTAVGLKYMNKTEKTRWALRRGSGFNKREKIRRKIKFYEEKHWVSEVESKRLKCQDFL